MRVGDNGVLVATLVALLVVPAAAETPADAAFARGREQFKNGNYAAACEQFERSQELDPQLGTLFNLAQCHEKIGKLSSALDAYRAVSAKDKNPERRRFAADLAKQLVSRVPKLVVQIGGEPSGLRVRLGEQPIQANDPVELDNGDYVVTVQADGMHDVTTKVRISEEGRTTTIVVPLTPTATPDAARPTQSSEATGPRGRSRRKLIGIATLAIGGVTLATGGVFGALAIGSWKDAKALCDGATCPSQADTDHANALRDQAMGRADVSNVLFIAGGAIALTGIVLWVTAPSDREVAISASADGGSVMVRGVF